MTINKNAVPATEELFCIIKLRRCLCPWRIFARTEAGSCSDMRSTSLGTGKCWKKYNTDLSSLHTQQLGYANSFTQEADVNLLLYYSIRTVHV